MWSADRLAWLAWNEMMVSFVSCVFCFVLSCVCVFPHLTNVPACNTALPALHVLAPAPVPAMFIIPKVPSSPRVFLDPATMPMMLRYLVPVCRTGEGRIICSREHPDLVSL